VAVPAVTPVVDGAPTAVARPAARPIPAPIERPTRPVEPPAFPETPRLVPSPAKAAAPPGAEPTTYKELVREARKLRRTKPDVALRDIDRALDLEPKGGAALVLKAELLLDRNNTEAAMAVIDRAIADDGGNAEAWRARGKVLLGADNAGAKAALQKYLELRPGAADAEQIRATIDSL
jgi:tetratricopeptide (TPR) repeat protein